MGAAIRADELFGQAVDRKTLLGAVDRCIGRREGFRAGRAYPCCDDYGRNAGK